MLTCATMRTIHLFPLLAAAWLLPTLTTAQNVGINATGAAPNAAAMLDVVSTTSGVLIPRMTAAQRLAIAAPVAGLLVYQTNASAPIPANHFWYYDGTEWRALFSDRIGWSIWGNGGTNVATNFLGTTDDVALRIRTNNTNRFEVANTGELRSFANGTATAPAFSWTTDTDMGVFRAGTNLLGFSTGAVERFRIPNANQVHAMASGTAALPFYSWQADANTGMWSPGADQLAFSTAGNGNRLRVYANGQVSVNQAAATAGMMFSVQAAGVATTAIRGIGTTFDGVYGTSTGAAGFGLWAIGQNGNGTGVGASGNNQVTNYLAAGSGGAFTGLTTGVYGYFTTGGVGQAGLFADAFTAQWRVGHWSGALYYKIIGPGLVSTIVKDTEDQPVVMFCPEAPEVLFQDHGIGQLNNGHARIDLDPILVRNIRVDDTHPLKVFVQLEGECNGVFVTNKSGSGFDVKELAGGTSNVPFSWSIVATRADETFEQNGMVRHSSYGERFPAGPENAAHSTREPR